MLGQREVILVGLGKFGKTVSNNLVQMIEERRIQLGKIANTVILHTVNFKDDAVFHSTDYLNAIFETVKNSHAYKNGEKFSLVFIGDFYETGTAKYALDFAYLPHLLQQTSAFNFDEVIGFFSFADQLGLTEEASDESLGLICRHFTHLEEINKNDTYAVPFKTVMGKDFKHVDSSSGPFDRNYVLVTPGKSDAVSQETSVVFAERIFYELFFLSKKLREQSRNWLGAITEKSNSNKNLSCFSMVQIPRVNEIQKYYLKYLFEEKIVSSFLAEPLKGTDEQYYFSKFMDMVDVPAKSDDFPLDRASNLFVNRYKENFSRILTYYVSGRQKDFKDYIEDCKARIKRTVFEILPCYDEFAHTEIDNFFKTLKTGFENLFKIERINGNFKTYIVFIEKLKAKLAQWEKSLQSLSESAEFYELEEDFNRVNKNIERLQKKKILSFLPFRPIRKKLIENSILSLPVEKYLDSLIKQNLAKAIHEYWKALLEQNKSPINDCEAVINNLKNLEGRLEDKEMYLLEKIKFIENMNASYYILPIFDIPDDYEKLLERIKNRNFGSHNSQKIKDSVTNALKLYVADKDIFSITQNPTEFIQFIENKFITDNTKLFSEIEEKIDEFYDFSKNAVAETKYKTENINSISFETSGTALFQNEVMLVPDKMSADCLSEEIDAKFDVSLEKLEVPKDFTLGSVVYFKDYLYMSQKDMKKKYFLENYKNVEIPTPEYDNSLTEKTSKMQQTETNTVPENQTADNNQNSDAAHELWKFTRSAIMFYLLPEEVVRLYNKTFNDTKEILSDEEIDNLALTLQLQEALKELSDEKLGEFARDNDIRLCESREKQEKLIVHELSQK